MKTREAYQDLTVRLKQAGDALLKTFEKPDSNSPHSPSTESSNCKYYN